MIPTWTPEDASRLMIEDPEAAYALLRGYMMLLGSTTWWRVSSLGKEKAWPSAVRAAIIELAASAHTDPKLLARMLDIYDLGWVRARVIEIATLRFERGLR